MKHVLNRLGSIKLALAILLVLACAAAFGTFLPRGGDMQVWEKVAGTAGARLAAGLGLTDFYHSIWFISLLSLLVVNLLACTINRIPGMRHALSGKAALGREPILDLPHSEDNLVKVSQALDTLGFRSGSKTDPRIGSRRASGYAFTLLTHGSVLVIMAFSIYGSIAGSIATQRVYIGDSINIAYNWKAGGQRPLPFELRSEDLTLVPNPIAVRLGVLESATGKKGKVIITHEGSTFRIPGIRGRVRMIGFDVERKDFLAAWTAPDGTRLEFGKEQEIGDTGTSLVLTAYATWPERQAIASVTVVSAASGKHSGDISVNHPMVIDGVRIYLTDYGEDKFGFPYVGFQFVRDPGQVGVWAGCILLLVCLPGAIFWRHSCQVSVLEDGRIRLYLSSREDRERIAEQIREAAGIRDADVGGGGVEA